MILTKKGYASNFVKHTNSRDYSF